LKEKGPRFKKKGETCGSGSGPNVSKTLTYKIESLAGIAIRRGKEEMAEGSSGESKTYQTIPCP
jgi:hypothetical protein